MRTCIDSDPGILLCPLCRAPLRLTGDLSVGCPQGHRFDLPKNGCVNLTGQKRRRRLYDAPLFESRRRMLEAGVYEKAARFLAAQLYARGGSEDPDFRLLDAGCGEGYFTHYMITAMAAVADAEKPRAYGLDLSWEAVALATDRDADVLWMVGDVARMPLKDHCVNTLLNILTPAAYDEFRRVLKPDGLLIKVLPGAGHLSELRALTEHAASRDRADECLAYARSHMKILAQHTVRDRIPFLRAQRADFLAMTPLTAGRAVREDVPYPPFVTVHLEILAGFLPAPRA
jgi:23S rRNA (guanine745-N1)-methyltransferase